MDDEMLAERTVRPERREPDRLSDPGYSVDCKWIGPARRSVRRRSVMNLLYLAEPIRHGKSSGVELKRADVRPERLARETAVL